MKKADKNKKNLKETLEKVEKERDEYLENWQRAQADFENYKKDEEKRFQEFQSWIKKEFIFKLIPILDSFNEALSQVSKEDKEKSWLEGIASIRRQLLSILKQEGVERIKPKEGDEFDPRFHEVVNEGIDCKQEIAKVLQPGYRMEEVVLRPARVELEQE